MATIGIIGSSAIFKTAYNEFKWYTEGVSGFVDVKDVARAMILLMNSEITRAAIYFKWRKFTLQRNIYLQSQNVLGKNHLTKKVTPFMAELIWRAEAMRTMFTGKKHLLTKETARTAQAKVYFDNSKILNALPQFQFTKINETIERTCLQL